MTSQKPAETKILLSDKAMNSTLLKTYQKLFGILFIVVISTTGIIAQESKTTADKSLKGSGRVNPSTRALEIDIPLMNYPGRGINLPISLSYSSKVWRIETEERLGLGQGNNCVEIATTIFGEDSASGWTTSLQAPEIEYTGWLFNNRFTGGDANGFPYVDLDTCQYFPQPPPPSSPVKRITLKMPSGETHELRMNKTTYGGPAGDRNGTYYAADGSNIIYKHNDSTNTYILLMPDGSSYEFDNTVSNDSNTRIGLKFVDRNGNYTTYNKTTSEWTDTLGRVIPSPFTNAPYTADIKYYQLPGMTGTYEFHWKKLKGPTATEADSALLNPSDNLKYAGDAYMSNNNPVAYDFHDSTPTGDAMFASENGGGDRSFIMDNGTKFNGVMLAEIKLPTGKSYKFKYDIYGRIVEIRYPTGGFETFSYETVIPLTPPAPGKVNVSDQANFGVKERKVYEKAGPDFYKWTYETTYVAPQGYKIKVTNPDLTSVENFLHRGKTPSSNQARGNWGFDDGLIGRPYETRNFDSQENLVSKLLTHWQTTKFNINSYEDAHWHPRVTHVENYAYDPSGNGDHVWTTEKFEYENEAALAQEINVPLLRKKSYQYGYQAGSGGSGLAPINQDPEPLPTPVPTPVPPSANLISSSETTYLINDTINYPDPAIRQKYKDKNMVGLVTVSVVNTDYHLKLCIRSVASA